MLRPVTLTWLVPLIVILLLANWWPGIDDRAETYLADAITDNLVIYATARSLNGLISVVQSIELSVSLGAGVGVNFGEVLDPLNDLIERFSTLVLYGLAGLGLQKLVLIGTSSLVMKVLVTVSLIAGVVFWLWRKTAQPWLVRLVLLLLLVRFAFVVEVGIIAALDTAYFDRQQAEAHSALRLARKSLGNLREQYMDAVKEKGIYSGLWETVDRIVGSDEQKGIAELTASAVVELIVIMLVRGLLLPLSFIWALIATARWLNTTPLSGPQQVVV